MDSEIFFNVETPLDFKVHTTKTYWELIISVKHPIMKGREDAVQLTLRTPDEIRRSRSDPSVYLFYRYERPRCWNCVVAKKLNNTGFIVTTYPTDAIKEGEIIWTK